MTLQQEGKEKKNVNKSKGSHWREEKQREKNNKFSEEHQSALTIKEHKGHG